MGIHSQVNLGKRIPMGHSQSSQLSSTMFISLARHSIGFGGLGVSVRGTTKYHLSPLEQRAFAGALSTGIPNTLWRIRSSFFTVVPTFVISYLIYDSAEKEHDRLQRKQPGQFDHEV